MVRAVDITERNPHTHGRISAIDAVEEESSESEYTEE